MDLFEDEGPGDAPGNAPEFSVSELSGAIKRVIEGEFGHVRIRGEIGRVSFPRSGHVYMDLKDDRSVISGVIWKGVASRLETRPEEGLEVIATGRVTTFPGQSKYQLVIEDLKPAGMGALMAMLEKRKAMLAAEGLFASERKRALPFLPEVIGVVTSPSGAVIRDILHRLRDRFPRKVLIWPVAVQGKACAPEVTRAIEGFNRLQPGGTLPRPDLLIVARGGGSIEDLWGFNEESVARAAAASAIPLISAVGHETDTTLIDFVSDRRAPTPSAAAELAVPVRAELLVWTSEQGGRLLRAETQAVQLRGQRLRDLGRALPRPQTLTERARQSMDLWGERLPRALTGLAQRSRVRLSEQVGSLRPGVLTRRVQEDRRRFEALSGRLAPALQRVVASKGEALGRRTDRLSAGPIARELARQRGDFRRELRKFGQVAESGLRQRRDRLGALDRLRLSVGYEATLERGYAVVRDAAGHVVPRVSAAAEAARLEIQFADGRLEVMTDGAGHPDVGPEPGPTEQKAGTQKTAAQTTQSRKKTPPPEQGSLF
ncbi:exodeoxyribonuclease VII large subunit [Pseudooceanicola sediminis]|uniref:Exodeoxyribonuclease 7 large subunit n=1 Tax=Pseudooceanicola sediminis TaxID=2211117 RepID=A0A399IXI1_9RHOB|nr:exodeoxyribonuclease VII large subunit [Pseudooceanicola sediminis]KAA2313083.1 exodeoxyribonuclease VII large subunit [Puniceibacterium sp. HSS470]RII37731.1 exodeoxyribonuclease VII large subunit [Pseudooceanicola sediminis]|tara:strand:+ start:15329 stop:16960 length:1632 start_codon:yes stop_codon:yes gene_type:complete